MLLPFAVLRTCGIKTGRGSAVCAPKQEHLQDQIGRINPLPTLCIEGGRSALCIRRIGPEHAALPPIPSFRPSLSRTGRPGHAVGCEVPKLHAGLLAPSLAWLGLFALTLTFPEGTKAAAVPGRTLHAHGSGILYLGMTMFTIAKLSRVLMFLTSSHHHP